MITIQKAVIAWAKMCETDLDRVTSLIGWILLIVYWFSNKTHEIGRKTKEKPAITYKEYVVNTFYD